MLATITEYTGPAPYRIDNYTYETFVVNQEGSANSEMLVPLMLLANAHFSEIFQI